MTRLLRALQQTTPLPAPVATGPARLRVDAAFHRSQRWLTPAPTVPADAPASSVAGASSIVAPLEPPLAAATAAAKPAELCNEIHATAGRPAAAHADMAETPPHVAEPPSGEDTGAALDRLAAWLEHDRRRQAASFPAAPRPHLPMSFQGWLDDQLRGAATRSQLDRIASRLSQRISVWERTITMCGLSHEADVALVSVALAAILGERGYRVALVELDAQQQVLAALVSEDSPRAALKNAAAALARPRPLPLSNVWLGSACGVFGASGRPAHELFAAAQWPEFDAYLATWSDAAPCAIPGGLPFHPGRLVAITRIGVTTRTDYQGFVRRAKNRGWQLEGCVVLGDRW